MISGEGKYYIYRYVRLDKNEPFYIGMGSKDSYFHVAFEYAYRRAMDIKKRNNHFLNMMKSVPYRLDIMFESDNREFTIQKEIELIALYGRQNIGTGPLVNMTEGGDGGDTGEKSEEAIQRLKVRNRTRFISEETRRKITEANTGRKYGSEPARKALETKRARGYQHSREGIMKRCTPVIQYDLNMVLIKEWDCMSDAAKYYGTRSSNISAVCSGRVVNGYTARTLKGFIWKYKNINDSRKFKPNYQKKIT